MDIHYFQRYHQKENVATANTMLLLSRLFSYSPNKFYKFLRTTFFPNWYSPEICMRIQDKNDKSIPDATIAQESFKIVIETKTWDWFKAEQLKKHLTAFADEKIKVLLTISSEQMANEKKKTFDNNLKKYNEDNKTNIIHVNLTFEQLVADIQEVLDDRDYEMQDVIDDYLQYCYHDQLIVGNDSWKYMKIQPVGKTIDFNIKNKIYYQPAERGNRKHDYIGLYAQKSIQAIGKINTIITAIRKDSTIDAYCEFGKETDENLKVIELAMDDAINYGYAISDKKHRYFFVDEFYKTDYKKTSPKGLMGAKILDLSQILSTDKLPHTKEIAERLKNLTWE